MFEQRQKILLGALFIVLLSPGLIHADTLVLKNGRRMEGIIKEETEENIILDIGYGTITVKKVNVSQIQRSDEDESQKIKTRWKSKLYDPERLAPPGLRTLAAQLGKLENKRGDALKAWSKAEDLYRKSREIEQKLEQDEKSYVEANRAIKDLSPSKNPSAYNKKVHELNQASASIVVARDDLNKYEEEIDRTKGPVLKYLDALSEFKSAFLIKRAQYRRRTMNEDEKIFFKSVGRKLSEYNKDYQKTVIPFPSKMGGHIVLKATINGRFSGTFLVDTGASMVSFSEDFARKLSLDTSSAKTIEVRLADGKTVKAKEVILRSVKVGNAEVTKVRAVVMKESPGSGIDGLLGMTFLRHFHIKIDNADHNLILKRLKP